MSSKTESKLELLERNYFDDFDLYFRGKMLRVEKQKKKNNFLVLVKVDSSSSNSYTEKISGTAFCILNNKKSVFADTYNNYSKGDIIIVRGKNDFIICRDSIGSLKYSKSSDNMILNFITSSENQMKDLINSTDM